MQGMAWPRHAKFKMAKLTLLDSTKQVQILRTPEVRAKERFWGKMMIPVMLLFFSANFTPFFFDQHHAESQMVAVASGAPAYIHLRHYSGGPPHHY